MNSKKTLICCINIFLNIFFFFFGTQSINARLLIIDEIFISINESQSYEIKKWTALYYLDVDWSSNNFDALEYWFIDEIASNENMNVIVIQDKEYDPAFMYYINENHNMILLEELGEINMGDYRTLKDYIAYGKENYPAERYQLNIYNHGGGWLGACIDITDRDQLSMNEFQQALSETGGVDLLVWVGCCLMGSLETVYELCNLVDVSVGSEDLGMMDWWNNIFDDICNITRDNPNISTKEYGDMIVDLIDNNPNHWGQYLTMSAIDVNKISELVESFNDLSKNLIDQWFNGGMRQSIISHRATYQLAQLQNYAESFEVFDFKEFIENLDQNELTEKVLDAFDDAVINHCHGFARSRTNGLSIFFPDGISPYSLSRIYNNNALYGNQAVGENLDFTDDTYWNEFLILFVISNILFETYIKMIGCEKYE